MRQSSKIVVFTGAGISTVCGIPDFRGPSGIWTLQRAHRPIPPFKVSFGVAKPSLCHQVCAMLQSVCAVAAEAVSLACTLQQHFSKRTMVNLQQALVALLHTGKLQHIVSQNVDGLHLRSGIPRSQLAELHGNCFAERCTKCKREYIRDFEMETVSTSMCMFRLAQASLHIAGQIGTSLMLCRTQHQGIVGVNAPAHDLTITQHTSHSR